MDLIQAIVLGIIQGLTEFLPISSTAHLRIVPALVGWPDPGAAFTAIIQLGTVAAVLIYFAKDLGHAFLAWLNSLRGGPYNVSEARLGWAVFVGTIPIVVLGLAFHHTIETKLRSLDIIAGSLIVMGLVMLAAERFGSKRRQVSEVVVKDGVAVGLWQCLALIPGMSRSGSTISGALFNGFDHEAAARFSFLLSVPSVFGAGVYEAMKALKDSDPTGGAHLAWGPTIAATVVAFGVGYLSIKFFMHYLQRRGIQAFVWYRVALGVLILVLLQTGRLAPDQGAPPVRVAAPSSR